MKAEQINEWLKKNDKDRFWLAKHCNVAKSTVDGWMAGRAIPKPTQTILVNLIFGDASISPRFTMQQFAKIQQKAKSEGISVDEWVEKAVLGSLLLIAGFFFCFHSQRSGSQWSGKSLMKSASAVVALLK